MNNFEPQNSIDDLRKERARLVLEVESIMDDLLKDRTLTPKEEAKYKELMSIVE